MKIAPPPRSRTVAIGISSIAQFDCMDRTQVLGVAVEKLAKAGERAGLSVHDLITLLNSGMTMEQLLSYLAAKLSDDRSVEN